MAETISAFKANVRDTREFLIDCLTSGVVPFVQGSPGIGKSAVVNSIAQEWGLELIDHRLSTSAPEDLSGLPEFYKDDDGNRRARFVPFDIFPIQGQKLPPGKNGWLLFLDEFNSASKSVQAASYKLILDKMVGQAKLHENVVIVAAGNLSTDRAITNVLSTAMQSRLVHIEMELNFEHFMKDVAIGHQWDSRIVAYLSYMGMSKLYDFRPDHNEKTFCCPWTWEFMHKLISGKTFTTDPKTGVYSMSKKAPLYAGTITSGVATDFINFTKVFESLPKFSEIIAYPETTPIPTDRAIQFAITTFVVENVTQDNFDKVAIFINRFSAEFRVLFFRSLMVRQPALRSHPAFRQVMLELSKYLND